MARCPHLEFDDHGLYSDSKFICKLCGQAMDVDDTRVKYTCKPDYGEEYKKCPVYQSRS